MRLSRLQRKRQRRRRPPPAKESPGSIAVNATSARVCLGVIVGVKGLRGEVRIKSFTEAPADVAAYGPVTASDGRAFTLSVTGMSQGGVVARLKGVEDRNAAEALRGLELFVERARLPAPGEGTFYHADLIGLAAELITGESLGKVSGVANFGGGDVMEIKTGMGQSTVVPFTDTVIAGVDLAAGKVTINPVPGLFDDGTEGRAKEEDNKRGGDAA